MLISIRNKTVQAIPELGLTANQTKVIWNSRPWFHPNNVDRRPLIESNLALDKIEFLNEFNEVIVYWSTDQNLIINRDLIDDMALFTGQNFTSDQAIMTAEQDSAKEFFIILGTIFRRVKSKGLPGYNAQNMAGAMSGVNLCELINLGYTKQAGTAINNIPTDAFFSVERKPFLAAICASLDLG